MRAQLGRYRHAKRLVRVRQGKGRKDRSAVIGATARRALLAYRRTLTARGGPLFRTARARFTGSGLLRVFQRLTRRTGIHVTAHAMGEHLRSWHSGPR
jgi:site-specific recombinase XerD